MPSPNFRDQVRAVQGGGKLIRPHAPHVYFIGGKRGAIKIGHTTDVFTRLSRLQTGSPIDLTVLAMVAGGEHVEGVYHHRFAAHRIRGEWFLRAPEVVAEIKRLNDEAGLLLSPPLRNDGVRGW